MKTENMNLYWGVFSDTMNFFIADKEFNVLFETPAFQDGHWTDKVKAAMVEHEIEDVSANMRTDANIDSLKKSVELDIELERIYKKRKQDTHE